jgi:hypothetical protein
VDAQAFSAAATFGSVGLSPLRKRASPAGRAVGIGDGRVAGIVSPCAAMQARNAMSAAPNWPPAPRPNPPFGRSDAQAVMAFLNAGLAANAPGPPLGRGPLGRAEGRAVGRAVGTLAPCWRRQVR